MSEVRAIRGATTSPSNSSEEILAATAEMLDLMTKEKLLSRIRLLQISELNVTFSFLACRHNSRSPGR